MVGIGRDPERDPEKDPHLMLIKEHRESPLEEETLDLHLEIEVGLDLHPLQEHTQSPYGKGE